MAISPKRWRVSGSRVHASSASSACAKRSARQPKPSPPSPIVTRSNISVVMPTPQPPSTGADLGARLEVDVVEEDLVEVGLAGDLAQRPDGHALGVHRHDEHRQALVLGHVGVGAGEQQAERGVLRVRRPDLLARQPPGAVLLLPGARLHAGEVGAGGGLGEELAPDLVGREHRAEVALLLLLGAVRDERRPEHPDADDVEDPRHAGAADLLVDDDLLERAEAGAAVLGGPGDGGQAALGELAAARRGGRRRTRRRRRGVAGAASPCAPRARRAPPRGTRPAPGCRSGPSALSR